MKTFMQAMAVELGAITVLASHAAFQGLSFGAEETVAIHWPVTEPTGNSAARAKQLQAILP